MKFISTILASVMCAGSPLLAQTTASEQTAAVQTETRFRLGAEAIAQIRSDYKEGKYDEFLSEMDEAYKTAKSENQLEGLIEIRKEAANFTIPQDKLLAGFEAIQKEKNKDLLKAIEDKDESLFVKKVQSATAAMPSKVQDASMELSSFRSKAPGAGLNSDENRLIEIDLENHYKNIHLDSLVAMGQEIPDRAEKHIVLEMQRMDQMVEASQDFEDEDLKSAIQVASESQDLRLTKLYDLNDLNSMARGKIKPESQLEEKVASIIATAHGKFSDLNQELLNEQETIVQK